MPNVLDDNVVILRFDNSDFEENTKRSIDSLERLKQSAESSGSEKGLEKLGKAANQINLSNLEKNVEGLHKRFGLLGTIGSAAITNLTDKAVSATTKIATAIPRQIVEGGWKRALNIEQAKFQIEGLKQIWDETSEGYKEGMKTVKASVLEAVNGTAFGLDEAAKVASQFAASGMKAGDDMTNALKGISGVAAMTGSSFEDIGRIFTTVAGNGRLMGDQLLQLSGRGINAAATLAEAMGKTEGEIREMVSKGKIDFETFYNAMNNAFGEHAKKANDTYTGSLANMKAALSRIGADLETSKLENMRHIFNALTPLIDQVHTLLGGFITRVNGVSTAVSNFAVKGINSITEGLKPYVEAVEEAKKKAAELAEKEKEATDSTKENAEETEEATQTFKPMVKVISGIAKAIFSVKKVLSGVGTFVKSFLKIGNGGLKPLMSNIGNGLLKVGGKAEKAASKFKSFAEEVGFYSKIASKGKVAQQELMKISAKGINVYGTLAKQLGKSEKEIHEMVAKGQLDFKTFSKAMIEAYGKKPIGKVLGFINNFVNSHKRLQKLTSRVKDSFKNMFSNIKESKGVESLKKAFPLIGDAIQKIAKSGLNKVIDLFETLFKMAKKFDALGSITNFFDKSAGKMADFIKSTANGTKPLTFLLNTLTGVGGKMKAVDFSKYFTGFAGLKLQNKAATASSAVMSGLVKAGDAVQSARLPEKFGKVAEGVKKVTKSVAESNAKVKIKNAKDGIIGFLKNLNIKDMSDVALKITKIVVLIKMMRDLGNVANATVGMLGSIGGFFRSLTGVTTQLKNNLKVEMFRTISMSILMLAGAVAVLALIPKDRFKPAMAGMIAIAGMAAGIIALLSSKNISAEKLKGTAIAFAGMGAAMLALATSVEKLSKIETGDLIKAGLTMTAFIGIFMLSSHAAKDIQKSGKSFLAMAAAVDALVLAVTALASLSATTIMEGGAAIMFLMTELALANRLAGKEGPKGLLGMALALDLLIPPLIILSMMPVENILKGAGAIGFIMTELAIASRLAGSVKGNIKTMVVMATMVGTVAASLVVLSFINPAKLTVATVALVGSITQIAGTIATSSTMINKAKLGALEMMGIIALMTAAIVTLVKIDAVKSVAAATALGVVAYGVATAVTILGHLPAQVVGFGIAALAAIAASIIAFMAIVGKLDELSRGNIGKGIDRFAILAEKIGNVFGKFVSGFMTGATSGLKDVSKNLNDFINGIKPFLESAKSIKAKDLAGVKALADTITSLAKGNLMSGLAAFVGQGDVDSSALSQKMEALGDGFIAFSETVQNIPDDTVKKARKVANIMSTLAEVFGEMPKTGGKIEWLTGSINMDAFTEGILNMAKMLGSDEKGFDSLRKIDIPDDLLGKNGKITKIVKVISAMSKAAGEIPPSEGAAQALSGNTTLLEFAEQLESFSKKMPGIVQSLGGVTFPKDFTGKDGKIAKICEIIAQLSESASTIPPSMGLKQIATGNTTISEFATMLALAIPGLKIFISASKGIVVGPKTLENIKNIADAISAMASASQKLPESGGIKLLTGSKNIGVFAGQLGEAAEGLSKFAEGAGGFELDKKTLKQIENVGEAVTIMAKVSKSLPRSGGLFQEFAGSKNIGAFGEQLGNLIQSLGNKKISGGKINVEGISSAAEALKSITPAIKKFKEITPIPTGSNLVSLGQNVISFINSMESVSTKGIAAKASSVSSAVKKLGSAASAGANGAKAASNLSSSGSSIANDFVSGIKQKEGATRSAGKSLGTAAAKGAKSTKGDSEKAGKDIGEGLVKGVKAKERAAYNAGYKVGKAAVKGEKDGSNSRSPSKDAIKVGHWVGEGLLIGLKYYEEKVYKEGYSLGAKSIEGQNRAIIDSINDLQDPVIRPVMDMAGVDYGFARIDNAFSKKKAMSIDSTIETSDMRVQKALNKFASTMKNVDKMRPNVINTNVNVDGAENPEDFAQRFVRQVQLEMRTG